MIFKALNTWWRHQMETFSALLAFCAGNSPVPGEFPSQRPVTRSFDVSFDLRLNTRLCKQSRGRWFKTPSCPLWRHRSVTVTGNSSQCHLSICMNHASHRGFSYVIYNVWYYSATTHEHLKVICANHTQYQCHVPLWYRKLESRLLVIFFVVIPDLHIWHMKNLITKKNVFYW